MSVAGVLRTIAQTEIALLIIGSVNVNMVYLISERNRTVNFMVHPDTPSSVRIVRYCFGTYSISSMSVILYVIPFVSRDPAIITIVNLGNCTLSQLNFFHNYNKKQPASQP